VTAAASAQVSKFCFHRAIPGIKLSHHVHIQYECVRPRQWKHSAVFWQSVNSSNYHGGPIVPKKYSAPEQKMSGQTDKT
jgi:hypothetical protein